MQNRAVKSKEQHEDTPSPPVIKKEVDSNDTENETVKSSISKPSVEREILQDNESSSESSEDDKEEEEEEEFEFWHPPENIQKTLDTVTITDVTADCVTITFRECRDKEGFFRVGCT